MPLTIWSARRLIETNAWIRAARPPAATAAARMPSGHESSLSAARIAKNAPISIIPSSPMFTTPERSLNMPPSAANVSGVAYRSIAARSADQTTTLSSFASPERVAR